MSTRRRASPPVTPSKACQPSYSSTAAANVPGRSVRCPAQHCRHGCSRPYPPGRPRPEARAALRDTAPTWPGEPAEWLARPVEFRRELGSGQVEAVEGHDLVPGGHEVADELLLGVVARVELGEAAEDGVRAEDEVDGGGRPLEVAGGPVPALVDVLLRGRDLPLRVHIEQVDEEVVGQCLGPVGEDSVAGLAEVGAQCPEAADEN